MLSGKQEQRRENKMDYDDDCFGCDNCFDVGEAMAQEAQREVEARATAAYDFPGDRF